MTKDEVREIKWDFHSHMSMSDEHVTTKKAEINGHKIMKCTHVNCHDYYSADGKRERSYTHYMVDGVIVKTRAKFYELMGKI